MLPEFLKKKVSSIPLLQGFPLIVVLNTVLSIFISIPVLEFAIKNSTGIRGILFTVITTISNYLIINLAVAVIIILFSLPLWKRVTTLMNIFGYTIFQIILIIDTRIFKIFKYHINSLVINVITTEGAGDSVKIGGKTIFVFIFFTILIIAFETALTILSLKRREDFKKFLKPVFLGMLIFIPLDKGLYAWADLYNITEITRNSRIFPLYQPLTMKRFASSVLGIDVNREENINIKIQRMGLLKYPKEPLRFNEKRFRRYNIILIIVDGLRWDMLDEKIMPETWRFSKESMVYTNHYSGGNGTRFGIFSILYGIHGSYWHNFLAMRQSPVLIDTLVDKGYDLFILSSTRLTFPEFRRTAFVRIPERIIDTFKDMDIPERDRFITERLIEYLSRRNDRPFFVFLYLNSTHQPYTYPEEFEVFKPSLKGKINYFKTSHEEVMMLRNKYLNAVYYTDFLIGKILKSLREKGLMENTMVIITGDHGEEFYENGHFGHTSAFNDYQLKTLFVMHHPERRHETVMSLTSHHDVVPTLMEILGCVSDPSIYSHGISLLSEKENGFILTANWDTSALMDDEHIIIFSTESYNIGRFEIRRKKDYSLLDEKREILRNKKNLLQKAIQAMSEFYK